MWDKAKASLPCPCLKASVLFSAATGSSLKCEFKWLPRRAPNRHICGFYLLEETGPELYHVLRADETGLDLRLNSRCPQRYPRLQHPDT
jgi:hypothetical protein